MSVILVQLKRRLVWIQMVLNTDMAQFDEVSPYVHRNSFLGVKDEMFLIGRAGIKLKLYLMRMFWNWTNVILTELNGPSCSSQSFIMIEHFALRR